MTPEALSSLYGRSVPEEVMDLMRAFSFMACQDKERVGEGVLLIPWDALRLVKEETPTLFRYDLQPQEFIPFVWTGVDGITYDLYFDGDEYVVVMYNPMGFSKEVEAAFRTLEGMVTARLLDSLAFSETQPMDEYTHRMYRESVVLMISMDLTLPEQSEREYEIAVTAAVGELVNSGRFPVLRRWLPGPASGEP